MRAYASGQLRNVVLLGHHGAGKTTLGESMLLQSGAIDRAGSVDAGNTVGDFDPLEHRHRYSISLAMLPVEWGETRLNVIDTPGSPDFEGDVACGVHAADAALVVVDAVAGIEGGTEVAWEHAQRSGLPRLVVVNRMDRENANFQRVLDSLRERFGQHLVPLAIPAGQAASFSGIVDLVSGRLRSGSGGDASDVGDDLADAIEAAQEQLVEAVAETDDDLLTAYLEGEEVTPEALGAALAAAVAAGEVVPVVPTSAKEGVGIAALLDAVATYAPSPLGREHATEDGTIATTEDGPVVAQVFKTTADAFVGRLTFLRILSGTLSADAHPFNVQRGQTERLGHLYIQRGKEQIEVPALVAGDIGVAAKLQHTLTGDSLVGSEAESVRVVGIPFPVPAYRTSIQPRTKSDVDKLSTALARIREQDPTIRVERDPDTAELVMLTLGDAQVADVSARLAQNFGVDVDMAVPRVPYRETISAPARAEYKHKKQTGGHGQYGHVVIQLEPLTRGDGFEFDQKVVGGNVPRQFIPAVEKGIAETLPDGPVAHSPVVDLRVTLVDGSSHSVDSSEMAFKIAASQALRQGILDARPQLLEPIVRLVIRTPSDNLGDVMSDLNGRRAQVHGVEPDGVFSAVTAEAPLAEVQRYAADVRALTGARGRFSLEFARYSDVPAHVQEQVLKELAAAAS